MGVNKGTEDLS